MDQQKKNPICEVCGKNEAISFSFFALSEDRLSGGDWKLTCNCTSVDEDYYVTFNNFNAEENETLEHLRRKRWMKDPRTMDSFLAAVKRYKAATR